MNYRELSIFISLILRHNPQVINITLDNKGYAKVNELIEGINKYSKYDITFNDLIKIVDTDKKQRYSFNDDKTLIRANQGHSINVNVDLEKIIPPDLLLHGTDLKNLDNIKIQGIKKMSRLYVHLTKDFNQALASAKRWNGTPLIIVINTKKMYLKEYEFFKSKNNVYLTEYIPPEYIEDIQIVKNDTL